MKERYEVGKEMSPVVAGELVLTRDLDEDRVETFIDLQERRPRCRVLCPRLPMHVSVDHTNKCFFFE